MPAGRWTPLGAARTTGLKKPAATIAGGQQNRIEQAGGAAIAGGYQNTISNAGWSVDSIGGGQENRITSAARPRLRAGIKTASPMAPMGPPSRAATTMPSAAVTPSLAGGVTTPLWAATLSSAGDCGTSLGATPGTPPFRAAPPTRTTPPWPLRRAAMPRPAITAPLSGLMARTRTSPPRRPISSASAPRVVCALKPPAATRRWTDNPF